MHASTSTAKPSILVSEIITSTWRDEQGVVYYELLKPNETITGDHPRKKLILLSKALKVKRPQHNKRPIR